MAQKPKRSWFDQQHLENMAMHIPIAVIVFVVTYLIAGAPLGYWPATVGFGLIGALFAIPASYLIRIPTIGNRR